MHSLNWLSGRQGGCRSAAQHTPPLPPRSFLLQAAALLLRTRTLQRRTRRCSSRQPGCPGRPAAGAGCCRRLPGRQPPANRPTLLPPPAALLLLLQGAPKTKHALRSWTKGKQAPASKADSSEADFLLNARRVDSSKPAATAACSGIADSTCSSGPEPSPASAAAQRPGLAELQAQLEEARALEAAQAVQLVAAAHKLEQLRQHLPAARAELQAAEGRRRAANERLAAAQQRAERRRIADAALASLERQLPLARAAAEAAVARARRTLEAEQAELAAAQRSVEAAGELADEWRARYSQALCEHRPARRRPADAPSAGLWHRTLFWQDLDASLAGLPYRSPRKGRGGRR